MNESPAKIDAILEPLVDASHDQADELLLQIINVHAEPVIKGVIRFKLRLNTAQRAEGDDIYQEVVLQLLAQLQKFRKVPDGHPIGDLRGMAAVIAHRTCARWLRRQFPERHALKNRLHYLVTVTRLCTLARPRGPTRHRFCSVAGTETPDPAHAGHRSAINPYPSGYP